LKINSNFVRSEHTFNKNILMKKLKITVQFLFVFFMISSCQVTDEEELCPPATFVFSTFSFCNAEWLENPENYPPYPPLYMIPENAWKQDSIKMDNCECQEWLDIHWEMWNTTGFESSKDETYLDRNEFNKRFFCIREEI